MVPPLFFCLKSDFGLGEVEIFILSLDHILGLAYPESLRSMGLMVEAVDRIVDFIFHDKKLISN